MKVQSIGKLILTKFFSWGKPNKKILFDSFGGAQYSLDPRAICEKMHSLYPDYELVWYLKSASYLKYNIIPEYVKIISSRFDYVKELAKACAYVTTEPINAPNNVNNIYFGIFFILITFLNFTTKKTIIK